MQTQIEKRLYAILIIVVIAFLAVNSIMVYTFLTSTPKIITVGTNEDGQERINTISVSGTGTITAEPDRAYISFAVWTEGFTATEALESNSVKMNGLIVALTDAGIDRDQIKTTTYSLDPIIRYPDRETEPPTIVGYIARNEIEVTLTDINTVGNIIDAGVAGGANTVNRVYFALSDEKSAELSDQAIQEAEKDANSKAKIIAESLNVKIVKPISVDLGYEAPTVQYERVVAAEATPIIPGAVTITANVHVTYFFE